MALWTVTTVACHVHVVMAATAVLARPVTARNLRLALRPGVAFSTIAYIFGIVFHVRAEAAIVASWSLLEARQLRLALGSAKLALALACIRSHIIAIQALSAILTRTRATRNFRLTAIPNKLGGAATRVAGVVFQILASAVVLARTTAARNDGFAIGSGMR